MQHCGGQATVWHLGVHTPTVRRTVPMAVRCLTDGHSVSLGSLFCDSRDNVSESLLLGVV